MRSSESGQLLSCSSLSGGRSKANPMGATKKKKSMLTQRILGTGLCRKSSPYINPACATDHKRKDSPIRPQNWRAKPFILRDARKQDQTANQDEANCTRLD